MTETKYLKAQSIDGSVQGSWISARPKALKALKTVVGEGAYQAREGANTGGANGVYWVSVVETKNGKAKIENLSDIGKRKVRAIAMEIEDDFLHPLLRGRDIQRWSSTPSVCILLPHQKDNPAKGYPEKLMLSEYPQTYKYFDDNFRASLLARKSSSIPADTFYSIYAVGPYTFAPYKVVWSEVGNNVEAAVVASYNANHLGDKVVIPDHTVVAISLDNEKEAFYVCAMLNSSPSQLIVVGYVVLHPSPHILKNIKIPKYDLKNETHIELACLSKQCHEKVAAGISVSDLEERIDVLAAELWGLSKEELKDIKDSLEEMQ